MIMDILRWTFTPRTRRLPLYLVMFVTYRCNSRCRTCFYHEELRRPDTSDLPLDFYARLARSIPRLLWLHLSGGEPFLREDLPELVAEFYVHSQVRKIGIPTNALAQARVIDATRRILEQCPDAQLTLVISLDGLEATHDYLRGVPGNYRLTMATIEELKGLREKYPCLGLNICTVLNNRNIDEIAQLMRLVKKLNVDFHDVGLIRGDFPDKKLYLPAPDAVAPVMDLVEEYASYYYSRSRQYTPAEARRATRTHRWANRTFLEFLRSGRAALPCMVGEGFCVIEPNGDVRLCELTPVVGNLRECNGDFAAFWKSDAIRKIRTAGICKEKACTHSNFQTKNILLNPFQWWRAGL